MAVVVALVAIVVATFIASSRLLRILFTDLDVVAYLGLFAACWIGAGGALVPVPGVRALSWIMVVQQGAALDPVIVALVAAFAMVVGQTSYFFAARAASHHAADAAPDIEEEEEEEVDGLSEPVDALPLPDPPVREEALSRRARAVAAVKERVRRQVSEHGTLTVFLVTALPTPLTTLTTTAAAASGLSYPRFVASALCGYLVLCSVLVLFGQGLVAAFQIALPSLR